MFWCRRKFRFRDDYFWDHTEIGSAEPPAHKRIQVFLFFLRSWGW
jgi:hypothetical protein